MLEYINNLAATLGNFCYVFLLWISCGGLFCVILLWRRVWPCDSAASRCSAVPHEVQTHLETAISTPPPNFARRRKARCRN